MSRARDKVMEPVEDAIDRATRPDHPRKYATTDEPARGRDLWEEQRRETDDIGLLGTDAQRKGAILGAVAGGLIGGLVFLPLGFISWGGAGSTGLRFLIAAIVGILAGSTGGALYWGGRLPELEGETVGADNAPGGRTSPRDPRTDERGRSTGDATGPVEDPADRLAEALVTVDVAEVNVACATCGNTYDDPIVVELRGERLVFDCFECAIHRLAPVCPTCSCRVIGHGSQIDDRVYCCASCARRARDGAMVRDRIETRTMG